MTLYDLIYLTNENANVIVYCNAEEVSRYDGKDSIDDEYNDREVIDVYPWYEEKTKTAWLCIEIEGEENE